MSKELERFELGEVYAPELHIHGDTAALSLGEAYFVDRSKDPTNDAFRFPVMGGIPDVLRLIQILREQEQLHTPSNLGKWHLVLEFREPGRP